ncbi:hypothetical protein LV84_02161 [Algoriphagus ratkowskyi]|uniref:Uncharacterized protein n=1 Tax=Algoriphagus ratkowskyi TaxID=57028 RepID=A0A2W7RF65_9BACT|nr:hypothetical protein LV84_02161 [Algoriphagus ratkowskyi]
MKLIGWIINAVVTGLKVAKCINKINFMKHFSNWESFEIYVIFYRKKTGIKYKSRQASFRMDANFQKMILHGKELFGYLFTMSSTHGY